MDDDDVQPSSDPRRWTMNWPVDETLDRTPRRTPLAQNTQLPLQLPHHEGEELENLFT